jgi:hypothetical protein
MANRRSSGDRRKPRRMNTQQILLTVIGLLVIAAFILGSLASY